MDLRLLTAAAVGWLAVLVALRVPVAVAAAMALVAGLSAAVAVVLATRLRAEDLLARESRARRVRRRHAVALTSLVVMLLAGACAAQRVTRDAGPIPAAAAAHRIVTVTGVVQSDPRPIAGAGGRQLLLVRVRVQQVVLDDAVSVVSTPVLVFGDDRWAGVTWRDAVRFRMRLSPSDGPAQDVVAVGSATGAPEAAASPGVLLRGLEVLRSDLRQATAHLPPDAAGLVPAMVIGDTGRVPAQLSADLRAAGLTHLTAVSGANGIKVVL